MITPADLELPEKFPDWRPNQLIVSAKIANSPSYAYLLDAPTGTGKSLIGAAVQRLVDRSVIYLCTTKQLQNQLLGDFPYAKTLYGRSNYPCVLHQSDFPLISAEDCVHTTEKPCKSQNICPYIVAKKAALRAPLAILNTSYYLHEANYIGGFSDRDLVIVDEFDTLEGQLMNFIEVVITQKQLDSLQISPPRFKTKFEAWVDWAVDAIRVVTKQLVEVHSRMADPWAPVDYKDMRLEKRLSRLLGKLRFFVKEVDQNWVWYPATDKWSFKPVWIAKYADAYFWKHSNRILGMSATILDARQVAVNVGLLDRTRDYKILPSPFPKENRPVYYEPCTSVTNKLMSVALPKLTKAVANIMEKHPNDKILVHTVSYKIKTYLIEHLPKGRVISHSAKDRASVLEAYKKADRPLVLLSPSMDRGVDLPDDQCRVVVIAKMPYPDLGDPQVNKRVYASSDGNRWYAHKTVSSVVQMAGRGVRSDTDFAITYILDEQFGKIYNEHRGMFPPWFKEAVVM